MVVRTQCKGRKIGGLYIGARNVRRYFPRYIAAIEFELGHLRIHCQLAPAFWHGQPEISDPRLCEWLEFRLYRGRSSRPPIPLAMLPSGSNAFKLLPLALPPVSSTVIGQATVGRSALPVRQSEGNSIGGAVPCKGSRFLAC